MAGTASRKRKKRPAAARKTTTAPVHHGKRTAAVVILVCLCVAAVVVVGILRPWQRRIPLPDTLTATSLLVLDEMGGVLAEKEADTPRSPGSLTKMLTLYLIFNDLEEGMLTLHDTITMTPEITQTLGSKYGFEPGQVVTVEQLLAGAILNSGCDCIQALVTLSAGSESAFVERMNQAAQQLGLDGSHFSNATGLDASDHYMTARDLGTLARRLVEDHPEYLDYSSHAELEIDGLTFRNLNLLVGADDRVLGLKTGTTRIGGNNLVTYARVEEDSCYVVLLDSVSESRRFAETQTILDLVFGGEG